jgi:ribosomal-protein-alanine N-acetyltransferase
MTGQVLLTEGGLADLAAVMAVMDDSFDPAFGEAWTSAQCAGLLPLPGVWLTLAWLEDEVVGFALSRVVADEAELLLLAVRHEDQGRGIGKILLEAFMDSSRLRGASRVHLEVREGNHAARVYERAGFSLVGRRRHYYRGRDGQHHDALTLARPIGALSRAE